MDKKGILEVVKKVSLATEQKSALPILSNILIDTAEARTTFKATDLEVEIEYIYPFPIITEEDTFLTDAKKLLKTLNSCPKNEIDFKLSDNRLNIKSGSFKAKLPISKNIDEFPSLNSDSETIFVITNATAFVDALKKVSHAVSKENNRYALQGVNIKTEENTLKIAATDGHRLAYMPIGIEKDKDTEIIIPTKAVNILQKLITGYEPLITVSLSKDENSPYIVFSTDEWQLTTRLLEGIFPQYEQILEETGDKNIRIPVNPVLNAVKRISSILDLPILIFEIKENGLTIKSKSEIEISDTVNINSEIEITIGINGKYLTECLSQFNGAECRVNLSTPHEKLLFIPLEEDNKYREVVMPVEV